MASAEFNFPDQDLNKSPKGLRMQAACSWLDIEEIPFRKTSEYQLKVGKISFYPHKGTIYIDGAPERHPVEGLKEFIKLATAEINEKKEALLRRGIKID